MVDLAGDMEARALGRGVFSWSDPFWVAVGVGMTRAEEGVRYGEGGTCTCESRLAEDIGRGCVLADIIVVYVCAVLTVVGAVNVCRGRG